MKLNRLHYSWVIVILTVFAMVIHAAIHSTFGIFLRPLTVEFGWDRGALAVAASIQSLVGGGSGILAGRLCDKYGPRPLIMAGGIFAGIAFLLMSRISSLWHIYLVWGILMGIAFSSVMIPITSTIPRWFVTNRGKAQGFTWTGGSIGTAIWPTFTQWIISSYGWRQAYTTVGFIYLLIMTPVAHFMKHSPQRVGLRPYGEQEITDAQPPPATREGLSFKQAIRTSRFWSLGLTLFFSSFCVHVTFVHIVSHAIDIGIPAMVAASIVSIIAIIGSIGRFSVGFFSDKVGSRKVFTFGLCMLTLAIVLLLFAKEVWMFYVFAAFFGIAWGYFGPILGLVAAELFGLKYLGTIIAAIMLLGTTGGA
ncbi:MFS transporter, partial [Chloroflexota bacterium]